MTTTALRTYIQGQKLDTLYDIVGDYNAYETEGSIGDGTLRDTAKIVCGSDTPIDMTVVAFEAWRGIAIKLMD